MGEKVAPYYLAYFCVIIAAFFISVTDNAYKIERSARVVHSSSTRLIVTIVFAVLSFIGGFRYYVGSDFGPYYSDYKLYAAIFFQRLIRLDEPGMPLLFRIATVFKDDPTACIFLAAAFTAFILIHTFYKYSDNLGLSLILYVFVIWHTSFNGIRQALAVAVFSCAYHSLQSKRLRSFLWTTFLAFLFHRSVVPFVVMYFLANRKVSKKNLLLVLFGTLILLYSYTQVYSVMGIIMDKEDYYLNYSADSTNYLSRSVNVLRVVFEMFPAAFFLLKYRELIVVGEKERIDFNINLLVIHAAVSLATSGSAYMARMSLYTMPFAVMSISTLLSCLKKNRSLYSFMFVALFAFFGYYEVGHSSKLIPFHWIWERG